MCTHREREIEFEKLLAAPPDKTKKQLKEEERARQQELDELRGSRSLSRKEFTEKWFTRVKFMRTNRKFGERRDKILRSWRKLENARAIIVTPPVESGFDPIYDTILFEESRDITIDEKKNISKDIFLLCEKLRSHKIGKLDTDFTVSGQREPSFELGKEVNQYLEIEEKEQKKLDEFRSCVSPYAYSNICEDQEKKAEYKGKTGSPQTNCLLGGAPPGQKDKKEKIVVKYDYSFQPRENSLTVHKVCPYHDLKNLIKDNHALREKIVGHQVIRITSMCLTVHVPKWVPEDKLVYHWEIMDVKDGNTQVRAYPPITLVAVRSESKEFYIREIPLDVDFLEHNETKLKTNSDTSMYPLLFLKSEGEDMYKLQHYDQLKYDSKMRMSIERRDPGVAIDPWLKIQINTCELPGKVMDSENVAGALKIRNLDYVRPSFDPKKSKREWNPQCDQNSSMIIHRSPCENCDEEMIGQAHELYSFPKRKLCEKCFDCLERDLILPSRHWNDKIQCRTCTRWFIELYGRFKKCSDCVTTLLLEQKKLNMYYCNSCCLDRTALNIHKWRDAKICEPCNSRRIKNRNSKYCIYCLSDEGQGSGTTTCNFCHEYLSTVLIPCEDRSKCWVCQRNAKEEYANVKYCTDCWSGKMAALFRHRQQNVKIYENKRIT